MAEKSLTAVIQDSDIQGVSTRSVDDLVKAMGISGISKSQVSQLCEEIVDKVKGLSRQAHRRGMTLPVDRRHLSERPTRRTHCLDCGHHCRRRQHQMAPRGTRNGDQHIRGRSDLDGVSPQADQTGLRGVKLVVSDAHEGINTAVSKVLNATWQRCRVELLKKSASCDSIRLRLIL